MCIALCCGPKYSMLPDDDDNELGFIKWNFFFVLVGPRFTVYIRSTFGWEDHTVWHGYRSNWKVCSNSLSGQKY